MGFVSEVSFGVKCDKLYCLWAAVVAEDNIAFNDFWLCTDLFKVALVALEWELDWFEKGLMVVVVLVTSIMWLLWWSFHILSYLLKKSLLFKFKTIKIIQYGRKQTHSTLCQNSRTEIWL